MVHDGDDDILLILWEVKSHFWGGPLI